MKKLLPLLLLILIGCSSPEPINIETMLIERNDVYYTKDTNQPYSGPVFSLNENGQIYEDLNLKNGIKEGPYKSYYDNGQIYEEGIFNNGKKDGPFQFYYKNGQIKVEGTFKDINPPFSNDIYLNFYLFNETILKDDSRIKDGLIKSYYENGQLKVEGTFKDGVPVGLFNIYWENGSLIGELNYTQDSKSQTMYSNIDGRLHSIHEYILDGFGDYRDDFFKYYTFDEQNRLIKEEILDKINSPFKPKTNTYCIEYQYDFKNPKFLNDISTRITSDCDDREMIIEHFSEPGVLRFKSFYDKEGLNKMDLFYDSEGKINKENYWKDGEIIDSKEY